MHYARYAASHYITELTEVPIWKYIKLTDNPTYISYAVFVTLFQHIDKQFFCNLRQFGVCLMVANCHQHQHVT